MPSNNTIDLKLYCRSQRRSKGFSQQFKSIDLRVRYTALELTTNYESTETRVRVLSACGKPIFELKSGAGIGSPTPDTTGNTPAQISSSMSSASSPGAPVLIFTEAAVSGRRYTPVCLNSTSLGLRASAQRPGRQFSVITSNRDLSLSDLLHEQLCR